MTCKRSKQCDHADICQFAQSDDYNLLGGSCFTPKDPQTNEEWLKHCNTEQLAEWLEDLTQNCFECGQGDEQIMRYFCPLAHGKCLGGDSLRIAEWLKQPHTVKE